MRSFITRLFPTPAFLRLSSIGLDASEATLRLVELEQTAAGYTPKRIEQLAIPEGLIQDGRVVNPEQYTSFLKTVQKKYNIKFARIAISESQTYSFTIKIDAAAKKDIRSAIEIALEDNIPLKAIETVFDYEIITVAPDGIVVQVVAMAEAASSTLFQCFTDAGIAPTSFEVEGQAIARAVLPEGVESAMVVDLGEYRTGIAIVARGVVVFSATLDFGGRQLTEILAKGLNVSIEEAEKLKRTHGFVATDRKDIFETLANALSVLKDEINRRYIYWHEKRQFPEVLGNVTEIYLTGGHSNLLGLADYLSVGLKIPVVQGNPWTHCFSFDTYIPTINQGEAMSYTTAIGLALTDYTHHD